MYEAFPLVDHRLGDGRRALEQSVLPVRPTGRALDATRHPFDGATVAFRLSQGGRSAASAIVAVEAERAATVWTLGAAGLQVLVAEAGDARVEFTASAAALGDPGNLAITTTHPSPAGPSFTQAAALKATCGCLPSPGS